MQRNIQEIITRDKDLDSDVGMNLIQLLGGSNDFYGTKRRRSSCTSATSEDSVLSGRSACLQPHVMHRVLSIVAMEDRVVSGRSACSYTSCDVPRGGEQV